MAPAGSDALRNAIAWLKHCQRGGVFSVSNGEQTDPPLHPPPLCTILSPKLGWFSSHGVRDRLQQMRSKLSETCKNHRPLLCSAL